MTRAEIAFNKWAIAVGAKFRWTQHVRKTGGSEWSGPICGFYSTQGTPIGYCVESECHKGSVQIWPEAALEPTDD